MRGCQAVIELSGEEREELTRWSASRTLPAGDVFKARLMLALADGISYSRIETELNTSRPTIARWKARFERDRIGGLEARHKGSQPRKATPAVQARLLRKTQSKPTDGSTQWTCSKMADATGLSRSTVQRIWAKTKLKPHRLDRYMASNDPQFEEKAADIIGLYLNPPQHAAVFCVDEKTAIQALDRLDPVLPLSPGRAERHGFEYYRHGTLSLYAALDVQTGKVQGKTAKRHTSADFIAFVSDVVERNPTPREIHIVLDNLSAHKTQAVRDFLAANPRVRFHFTPTYSSWLNQVEIWFARIQRDVISRGVFTSVADLSRKLMKYIRGYAKSAKPFRWSYCNPAHRIAVTKSPR
ncbi:MAG TPA: IS630 family transposase [Acidobacteriaceae bacterium]|jgi:transposase|nr:IS630 family transposase [Acidobacteriaceae bacterium]